MMALVHLVVTSRTRAFDKQIGSKRRLLSRLNPRGQQVPSTLKIFQTQIKHSNRPELLHSRLLPQAWSTAFAGSTKQCLPRARNSKRRLRLGNRSSSRIFQSSIPLSSISPTCTQRQREQSFHICPVPGHAYTGVCGVSSLRTNTTMLP